MQASGGPPAAPVLPGIRIELDVCDDGDHSASSTAAGTCASAASTAATAAAAATIATAFGVGGVRRDDSSSRGDASSGLQRLTPPARSQRSRSLPSVHEDAEPEELRLRLERLSAAARLPDQAQRLALDTMPLPPDANRQRRKSFDFVAMQNLGSIKEQD